MELEIIRCAAAGVADATIGLNAKIGALVLDTLGDARPSNVTVYNYVDHAWVARKALNAEEALNSSITPAVAVYLEAAPVFVPEIRNDYRDGDFPIAFSYLSIAQDAVKLMRDALYVNRAMLRFLTAFHSDAQAAMRLRNNVSLYHAKAITQYTPFQAWGDVILAAQTIVTYTCREHQPS